MAKKVILASGSPRRKELLEQVGVEFEQRVIFNFSSYPWDGFFVMLYFLG